MSPEQDARAALAAVIEREYVDPDLARVIADEVRSWDEPADSVPFEAWTTALRRHDGHLRVAAERPERPASTGVEPRGDVLSRRRAGDVGVLAIAELVDPDEPGRRAELEVAMRWLERHEAVILDLRGNRGGWPTMVELVVGALFGAQSVHILDVHHRGGSERSTSVPRASGSLAMLPVAVLVDHGTASAAESLAYALSTMGRATIVGEATAGAANPGDWFEARAGLWAFVSTGAPIDPRTGTAWEGVGVVPDLETSSADAERVAVEHLAAIVASGR